MLERSLLLAGTVAILVGGASAATAQDARKPVPMAAAGMARSGTGNFCAVKRTNMGSDLYDC
jgi:hypothetical protein